MPQREEYNKLLARLDGLQSSGGGLVAIDGRCGSGKSTLARELARRCGGAVVHMDDFYLPPEQRREDWMEQVGGNMDFGRLRRQLLAPIKEGKQGVYQPYLCRTGEYGAQTALAPGSLLILEGSYSHHPALETEFDLKIFLTCSPKVQQQRLLAREGERYARFREIWIPLEERYFAMYGVQAEADLVLDTGEAEKEGWNHG